jgi:ribose transport system permease protein
MKNKAGKSILNLLKALILPAALYFLLWLMIPERIGNWNSFTIMLSMSIIPTIVACGVSFGWISGIMDFSIGACVIFSSLVGAVCGNLFGIAGLFLGSIIAAFALSAVNGMVFRLLRIPSLVVSLGIMMVFEVLGNKFAGFIGRVLPDMSTGYYIRLDQTLTFLGTPPWNFVVLAVVLIIYSVVYYRTKFSNQARVVGSDEIIAQNVGIKPMNVKFQAYLVGAFFLGIAAAVTAAYSGSATPQTNMTTMGAVFRPIMSVVLALSLQKLVAVPIGIFIGSLSMSIIFTGIIALGWNDDLQNVLLGLMLIIVVSIPKVWGDLQTIRRRRFVRRNARLNSENEA